MRLVEQRPDNDAADHHRQIRGQTAVRLVFPEKPELIVCQSRKDPLTQSIAILRLKPDFPLADCMIDHMQDETEKSIDKIFPSPVLPSQATFQQCVVHVVRGIR